jgi:hypothetical protein
MNFLDPKLPERFWKKVIPEPNSGCWLWLAGTTRQGYGQFQITSYQNMLAHRVSFEAANGKLDAALVIDHKCQTTCCVNPEHLQQVTAVRNTALRRERSTRCRNGHEYTPENTHWRERTERPGSGQVQRVCLRCVAAAHARYYAKNKDRDKS